MPPLIAFAGALGGLAVVRWAYRTAIRVNRELEEARLARVAEAARSNDIPTLRRDPNTGAYRPGWGAGGSLPLQGPCIGNDIDPRIMSPGHCLDSLPSRRYGPARLAPGENLT